MSGRTFKKRSAGVLSPEQTSFTKSVRAKPESNNDEDDDDDEDTETKQQQEPTQTNSIVEEGTQPQTFSSSSSTPATADIVSEAVDTLSLPEHEHDNSHHHHDEVIDGSLDGGESSSSSSHEVTEYKKITNPYQAGNMIMRAWCQSRLEHEKIFYFSDFDFASLVSIIATDNERTDFATGKTAKTPGIAMNFRDDKLKYSAIQTPIGVLTFSSMTYDGNKDEEGMYAPKTPLETKQKITWSARAYCEEGRDEYESELDAEGVKFYAFIKRFATVWFLNQLMEISGSAGVAKHYDKIVADIKDKKKEAFSKVLEEMRAAKKPIPKTMVPSNPTKEEILQKFQDSCFLAMMRKDKHGIPSVTFSSKLFRKLYKNETTKFAKERYRAPTPFIQSVHDRSGGQYVFNDLPIYTLRSKEERAKGWGKEHMYKKIPRELISIENGTLGSVVFEAGPTVEAGGRCAMMGYVKAVILYGKATTLSKTLPGREIAVDKFPLLAEQPELGGSCCFYDENALKHIDEVKMDEYALALQTTDYIVAETH